MSNFDPLYAFKHPTKEAQKKYEEGWDRIFGNKTNNIKEKYANDFNPKELIKNAKEREQQEKAKKAGQEINAILEKYSLALSVEFEYSPMGIFPKIKFCEKLENEMKELEPSKEQKSE